jgi:putative tricarboxylic transport membrane protein
MKWFDRIAAFVLLVIAGVWIYMAIQVPFPTFARVSKLAPGHYPMAVAVLLAALAIILLGKTFKGQDRIEKKAPQEENIRNPKAVQHLVTGFVLFFAYVLSVPILGFALATPLFAFLFIWSIGRYSLLHTIPIAVGIPLILWIIFAWWLSVPVPKGPWGF